MSSEAESFDDVWAITDEQKEYYINQFKTMQPDVTGVISGESKPLGISIWREIHLVNAQHINVPLKSYLTQIEGTIG